MLPTKFQLIWPNGYREKKLIGQSQTRTVISVHICCMIAWVEFFFWANTIKHIIKVKVMVIAIGSLMWNLQHKRKQVY